MATIQEHTPRKDRIKELQPLYYWHLYGKEKCDKDPNFAFVEGIVFTHKDGRMTKLRRDMFDWHTGKKHKEEEQ